MKYSVNFFKTTFCFCLFLLSHVYAAPIEFTLIDGTHWIGDTETIVKISTKQGAKIGRIIELSPYNIKLQQESGNTFSIDKDSIRAIVPVNVKSDTSAPDQTIKDTTSLPLNQPRKTEAWLVDGVLTDEEGNPIDLESMFGDSDSFELTINRAEEEEEEEEEKTIEKLPIVYTLQLTGNVGFVYGEDSDRQTWFSASIIRDCFEIAKKKKAESLILEISSDDGNPTAANSICNLIEEYRDDFNIIAYPHRVQGPATGIVMTCDTIISAPDSQIGPDPTSSGNANLRKYYSNADRSLCFVNAFGDKKNELHYSHATNSFSNSPCSGCTEVDGASTSLVLHSSELVTYGISERHATSIADLPLTASKIISCNSKLLSNQKKAKIISQKITSEIAKIFSETYDKKHRCKPEKYCYSPHPPPDKFTISDMMRELVCRINITGETERFYRDSTKIAKNIREIIVRIRMTADRIVKSDINGKYPFQLGSEALCKVKTAANFGEEVLVGSKIIDDDRRTVKRVDRLLKQFISALGNCNR